MSLSNGERLILVMLAEFYRANKIKGEIDPDFVLATIFNDQTWAFGWKYQGIFRDEKTPPVVIETCDILDMYRRITVSLKRLSTAEHARVLKEISPFEDYLKFQGFDFNSDPHSGVVSHLVEHLDRYEEINPDLNSHSSATISHYRSMLARIRSIPTAPQWELNPDQIIAVVKG
jgi:uncharacterized protein YfbU (UPF0304 family)